MDHSNSLNLNILNLNIDELAEVVTGLGEKSFRAKQIFGWLAKGAAAFDDMTNVPKSLRDRLAAGGWYIGLPEAVRVQESKDGTVKCLFRFDGGAREDSGGRGADAGAADRCIADRCIEDRCAGERPGDDGATPCAADRCIKDRCAGERPGDDGETPCAADQCAGERPGDDGATPCAAEIESVFMRYEYGNSICISSQVGCRMGCSFCASTMDGLDRSLTGGEMLGEVLAMRNLIRGKGGSGSDETINHVVIMGMGEPFDNYDEVARFIRLIHDEKGYNLSLRNITVSTCGIIPGIERFAEDFPQVNLAVSLHAPNQALRQRTMPVAKKYGYDELMDACRAYTEKTGRRITFEYAVIDGVNDSRECAEELAGRLKGWLTHVNLIPLNEVEGREYRKAQDSNVRRFKEILEKHGVAVTIRRTLGSDIDAACGQLRRRSG